MRDDTDLHERFAAMRRRDAQDTPSFMRLMRASRRARTDGPMRALATCLTIAALALAYSTMRPHATVAPGAAPWLADWRAPTDFLLDTPGSELLHAVPAIGLTSGPANGMQNPGSPLT